MANYSAQVQRFGLKKEGTRLTAESAPDTWIDIHPDARFDYSLEQVENPGLRGVKAKLAPFAGRKVGTFKFPMMLRAQNVGEFFHMLIGDPSSAQQASTTAYLHSFVPGTGLQLDTYTTFVDRSLDVCKYNGCSVSEITIDTDTEGMAQMGVSGMFITEATGASIGSPSYSQSGPLGLQHLTVKIAGSTNTEVKSVSLKLSNGMFRKPVYNQSQDAADFLTGQHEASGSFVIFFANTTERAKFLANTASSLQLVFAGDTIESSYKYTVDLLFDEITYQAFPYETADGLLAATVNWMANHNGTRLYKADITNTKTAY